MMLTHYIIYLPKINLDKKSLVGWARDFLVGWRGKNYKVVKISCKKVKYLLY